MDWHPNAVRVPYADAGPMVGGGKGLLWHTTEGFGLPAYNGTCPHFTFDPRTGRLWQHVALSRAAKALMHPPGTMHTNRANKIQVELIGKAAETNSWNATTYARIAGLARWIENNAGVPRRCTVAFTSTGGQQAHRMGQQEFYDYAGHCGHEHAASNLHWDPGRFRIALVIGAGAVSTGGSSGPLYEQGDRGAEVALVQHWINVLGNRHPGHYRQLNPDGVFGPATWREVRVFQGRHSLTVDGIVGQKTWNELRTEVKT
jgi:hypothetical protein